MSYEKQHNAWWRGFYVAMELVVHEIITYDFDFTSCTDGDQITDLICERIHRQLCETLHTEIPYKTFRNRATDLIAGIPVEPEGSIYDPACRCDRCEYERWITSRKKTISKKRNVKN